MTRPYWWRSLAEHGEDPDYLAAASGEFPPAEKFEGVDRRRFLQLLAASAALGGLGGCHESQPPEHIVPRVDAVGGEEAGVPRQVATALVQQGYATGAILQHRMGRPVKLEGNPDHPASLGAADATMQAAVLDLYDPERSTAVLSGGQIVDWNRLALLMAEKRGQWSKNGGAGLRLLTGRVASPTLAAQIAALLKQYPAAGWHQWEPLSRDAVAAGATLAFGKPVETLPDFTKADIVLGIESDAIAHAPGHLAHARAFASRRAGTMSRVYAIEATPTLFGASADHRFALKPAEIELALRAIAARVGAGPAEWSGGDRPAWIDAAADDLAAHKGAALVHAGAEQTPAIHALAHAINAALAAPVRIIEPVASPAPGLAALAADMQSGKVDTLLILGANPVYDAPADLDFAVALSRVKLSVQLATHVDETAQKATYHVPALHPFEEWGDARAFDGTASLIQPQIRPLVPGHGAAELIALAVGAQSVDARALVRRTWHDDAGWDEWLRQGVIPNTVAPDAAVKLRADFAASLPKPAAAPSGIVVLLRPDPFIRDGSQANNGWLQELPRPLTRLTWDNAALIAPKTAKRLGLDTGDVVALAQAVEAPALILPGQAEDCVTLSLGYGRAAIGRIGAGVGTDAGKLRRADALWQVGTAPHPTGEHRVLALTQHQQNMAGRDLVRTRPLAEIGERKETVEASLYPPRHHDGNAWAMTIDLGTCIGCGACTAACQAENNIPVVGREQVLRERSMHWIRVDRYWGGAPDHPEILFQPVPCMHCEDAPCEVVCPVGATVHDSDGLNVMVYNRCVGTRFCSNNCPYKVRRFNFYGYTERDNRPAMSWNPDVTVRGRGVMEKCTYCIQRIRETKIAADRDDRPIRDGEIVTACQQACPTRAIVFGDINDPRSEVTQKKASPLDYTLLEELNTRPRTSYAARVTNRNPAIAEG